MRARRRTVCALKATDLDIEIVETIAAEVAQELARTTVPGACALRYRAQAVGWARRSRLEQDGQAGQVTLCVRAARASSLQTLPESDFPDLAPGEMSHHFEHCCRGSARTSSRRRSLRSRPRKHDIISTASICMRIGRKASCRCDRRPPACPVGSSTRPAGVRGHAGRDRAAQDGLGAAEAADGGREDGRSSSCRASRSGVSTGSHRADIEADRRHLSRLPARHSAAERQDPRSSSAPISPGSVDRVSTISCERGRAVKFSLGDGKLTLVRAQSRCRAGDRGAFGRL